ncbi:MAG: AMP-binding protein, partial [bacterium]
GDTVAITAPNQPEFTAAALGAWKIGACIAPVHIGHSEHEIAKQMDAVAPAILLTHESDTAHQPAMTIASAMRGGDGERDSAKSDSAAIESEFDASDAPTDPDADRPAARIYTSGSTGTPKVVRLSHRNLASNLLAARRIETFGPRDRFLSLLPLSHAMGLLGTMLLPLHHGAAIVAPKSLAASEILAALREERISVLIAVPRLFRNVMHGLERRFADGGGALALYREMLKRMPLPLRRRLNAPIRSQLGGRITAWVSGGSHLDGRITRYYHDLGLPLRQGYGLTETSPLTSIQQGFDDAVESVGRPIEGVRVKIHQPDDNGDGEIWIRGANVMLGYDDRAQTDEAMRDGWFKSGDIGHLDTQGRIFLTGRSKRLIVTEAGKNVYPEELETLLERNPAIKEAGVLEVGMKPVCVLAMDGDDAAHAANEARAALADFNQLVSAHNRIARFAVVDELPRTPLGKIALQSLPAVFAANEAKREAQA